MSLAVATLHRGRLVRLFDCACRASDRGFSPTETVDATQIVLTRAGHFVRRVGSREIAHEPGSASLFVEGEAQQVRHPHSDGDHCATLIPTERALDPLADLAPRSSRATPPLPPSAMFLLARLNSAVTSAPGNDELGVEEACLALYSAVLRLFRGESSKTRNAMLLASHRRLVNAARELLAATFRENVDLTSLSAELGCSPFHLCRVFKRATGRTLAHHRLSLRLLAALDAIEGGARDLTRLALDLGFADHSHLTNSFTRVFGVPPSTLRSAPSRFALRDASNRLQAETQNNP